MEAKLVAYNAYELEDDQRRYEELIARNQWGKQPGSDLAVKGGGGLVERIPDEAWDDERYRARATAEFMAAVFNLIRKQNNQ